MQRNTNEHSPDELEISVAFEILKFYEEMAGKVKSRTWTMSSWILSVNSALMAFCFSIPKEGLFNPEFSITAACLAGIVLCTVLALLICSQGSHLKEYMKHQLSVLQKNTVLGETIEIGDRAVFPWFCRWLLGLTMAFAVGFIMMGLGIGRVA